MRDAVATHLMACTMGIAVLAACAAGAQSAAPAAPAAPGAPAAPAVATGVAAPTAPVCRAAEHRQFDFWLGDWTVSDANGRALGTNRIESLEDGCVMQEHWASARGGITGTSLTAFDVDLRRWHQTWMDSGGNVALLDGGSIDGRIVLFGDTFGSNGQLHHRNRISWIPLADGRVRQWWEQSTDDGKTWSTVFDGYYARKR
jgi:hypothetical protein